MEDEFLLMEDESALDGGKAGGSSPTKWVVSLALLFLVPALVITVVLSNRLQIGWLRIDIVVCILTALFCVLVAVSLTLSGSGEQFRRMEQGMQPTNELLAAVRSEQTQLSKAVQSGNQNLLGRIARLEENQHALQDSAGKVGNAVGEEYNLLRQVAHVLKQELANGLSVTTGNHKELHNAIARLQQAGESVSEKIAAIPEAQEELRKTLQAEIELLADRIAAIPEGQTELKEALQKETGHLAEKIGAVSGNQQELKKVIQAESKLLAEKIGAVSGGQQELKKVIQAENELLTEKIAAIPEGQDDLRETVQAESKILADKIMAIPESQDRFRETLHTEVAPLVERIAAIPEGHERLREDLQATVGSLAERIAAVPEGQQKLREALQAAVGSLAERIAVIPEGQQRLREALQTEIGLLVDRIATIPEGQERLREALQAEIAPLAESIAAVPESQEALRGTLHEDNRVLADRIAAVAEIQEGFHNTLREENPRLADRIADLSARQEQLVNATNTLQVLTQTTTSNIANIADEQTALHKTLRENIDAQATSTHAAEQYQQAMEQQVGRVGAASQQVAETLTAVRAGQTALLETIEAKNEELANQLQALSTAQQSVQAGIDSLEHRANGTMAEVSAIGDGQASAKEMLHAHAEAVNSQMASLAAKGEQIDDGLARLHELAEAIAGTAAGIASEQGSQHRSEQDDSQMLAAKIESARQSLQDRLVGLDDRAATITANIGSVAAAQSELHRALESGKQELASDIGRVQQTLHEGVSNLAERATLMAEDIGSALTAQANLRQLVETNDNSAASKLTALLESQLTFHAGANLVSEKTEHAVTKVAEVAERQIELSKTLQAHVEAFNAEIPPLVAGNGQLKVDVDHLRELAQTVADTVTRIADEQATLQDVLQNNTQVLTENITFNEQNQKTLQREVNRVAEAGEQTTTAVTGMASEQTELRDLLRTNNKELIKQCSVITESQRALITGINSLGEKTAEAAARVAGVTSGQSLLAEAVQAHTDEVNAQMSALSDGQGQVTNGLTGLQQLAKTVSNDVTRLTEEQSALQTTVRDGVHTLDSSMRNVTERQQALEKAVDKVAEGNQETAAVVTTIAAKQTALQETLETENREMNDQFASLSEEQHSLRVEVSRVAESGQETAANTDSIATYQAKLNEMVDCKSEELNQRLSSLSDNQQILRTGIGKIDDKIAQTSADLGAMAKEQTTLHKLAQDRAKEADDQVDALVQTQRDLRDGIGRLQQTSQQAAEKITQIAEAQSEKFESVQHENEELLDRLNTLTSNQGQLHSNVNGLREIAQRTAVQVKDVADGQAAAHKTLESHTKTIAENNATVTENQQALKAELGRLAEASRQAAAVVTTMATDQSALCETMRTENRELSEQFATLSQDQQASIERLSEATRQFTTDLMGVDNKQTELGEAIQAYGKDLVARVNTIKEDQQQWLRHLATDLTSVDGKQAKLGEAIQAYGEDLVARVNTIKEDQQQWLEQFDAAQAKIHPMWARIDAMGQEVVQFQETLQRSIQELSDLLDARNQQRIAFEERVNQDLVTIGESVARIQEVWGALQARVRAKKGGKETRSEDISWAIAQLKNQAPQPGAGNASRRSTAQGQGPQPVDASLNIELDPNDG